MGTRMLAIKPNFINWRRSKDELKDEFKGQEVDFLAVTYDQKETVQRFLQYNPFNFTIIPDAQDLIKKYDIFL